MTDREPSAILTDEQINQIQDETGAAIWGGATEAAIQAAARMGMLRAAEICDDAAADYKRIGSIPYDAMEMGAASCADDIRAAAETTPPPREPSPKS